MMIDKIKQFLGVDIKAVNIYSDALPEGIKMREQEVAGQLIYQSEERSKHMIKTKSGAKNE